MTFLHLAYLQQVSDLLESEHKPLAARLGFIASKISAKHLVRVNGADPPKLRRCKACQAPINCDNIKTDKRKLVSECSLCGFQRRYSVAPGGQQKKSEKETQKKKKKKKKQPEPETTDKAAACSDAHTT